MYINVEKLTNKHGKTYLYKTITYYEKGIKNAKKKREPLGRLNLLEKIYNDPVEHFRKLFKEEAMINNPNAKDFYKSVDVLVN